jgi:DNA-binding transcriptional LysR family regulator
MRYALAVAEHRHFGRAARALGVRQPALSQQIKQLERELGIELFERHRDGAVPTAAGAAFCEEARNSVAAAERAEQVARRVNAGAAGVLRVGYVGSAMYWLLPAAIREFHRQYPDVELDLVERGSYHQAEELAQGYLDLGLLRAPLPQRWPELRYRLLARETLTAVVPAGHPLTRSSTVPLPKLAQTPLVVVRRRQEPASYDQIMRLCQQAGFEPTVAAEADQVQSVLGLVAAGVGVALGPSSLQNLQRPDIVYRPLTPRVNLPDLVLCRLGEKLSPAQCNFDGVLRALTGTGMLHRLNVRAAPEGSARGAGRS